LLAYPRKGWEPKLGWKGRNRLQGAHRMKIFFGIVVVALVAASVYADYKWRKWIEERRRDRQ
jgi:hypothetical protein